MFGEKATEITRLTAENAGLVARLEEIEHDPYYVIGEEIKAEVAALISDHPEDDARLKEAVERRRQEILDTKIADLANAKAQELIAAKKDEIEAEAADEVGVLAAQALTHFLVTDADAFREQRRQHLLETQKDKILQQARQQIEDDERQRLVEAAGAKLATDKQSNILRKQRAYELREESEKTKVIRLSDLQADDVITVAFTAIGSGFEKLYESNGGGTYRSGLEMRKMTVRIIDTSSGLVEMMKDSWSEDQHKRQQALQGGKQYVLSAVNPLSDTDEPEPVLVKGEPVFFEDTKGVGLDVKLLDVWWIDLGKFRILS